MMKKVFTGFIKVTRSSLPVSRFFIFLLVLFNHNVFAQTATIRVSATLDTNKIRLGEQVQLSFDVIAPKNVLLLFPYLPDTLQNIEVVERSVIDTLKTADASSLKYHQKIIITCFDPGIYMLQPFTFYYGYSAGSVSDSVATEMLTLRVDTIMVDTMQAIKDIKAPFHIPFSLREALPYIVLVIAAIAVIAYILYQRRKRNRKSGPEPKISLRQAHEIAIETLKKLQEQKLWQQGLYKEYHSQVSDTIRTYIEHRFSVSALELPSDDTLERLARTGISSEAFEKLRYIFQIADMVKFAKSIPLSNENELSMQNAFEFVMITKPEIKDDFEVGKEEKEVKL